jgi:hypothetical protein
MTLKEFTNICIELEMKGQNTLFLGATQKKYKKRHKFLKSKDVIKTVTETLLDDNFIPYTKVTRGTTKKVNDTNAITKIIEDYMIVMYGCLDVRRVSSEGRWRKDASKKAGGFFLKGLNKGMADVEGTLLNGIKFAIELKASKGDTQRKEQIQHQSNLTQSKAIYYLCRWVDFETFQKEIQQLIPIQ